MFKITKIILLLMSVFIMKNAIAEQFMWGSNHIPYFADYNNDGITDVLLQANTDTDKAYLIIGVIVDKQVAYLTENSQILPALINHNPWSSNDASFAIGDFNGDDITDVFIHFPFISKAHTFIGNTQGLDFSNPPNLHYSTQDLPWLNDKKKYNLHVGDFNGDNKIDLLAVTEHTLPIVMHSDQSGYFQITQILNNNVQWGKDKTDTFTIADYNGDGKDDIFIFSQKKHQPHFVVLADQAGKLSPTNTQQLPYNFAGVEWNTENYSHTTQDISNDNTVELIRLKNAPGGFDEHGNYYPEGELPPEALEDIAIDDININIDLSIEIDQCQQVFYSIVTQTNGATCAPWIDSTQTSEPQPFMPLQSAAGGGVDDDLHPPETPTNSPIILNNYHPVNKAYAISFPPRSAQYYQLYESTNGTSYSLIYTGSNFVTTRTHSSYGRRFYKYKACNQRGCSGYSPYRAIYIYTAPGTPPSISSSSYTTNKNTSYVLTFGVSGGSVDGGTYYLQESYNGGNYSTVCTKIRNSWRETSYSCQIAGKQNSGDYKYRVYTCNPQGVGCGGKKHLSQSVSVNNRHPSANNDNSSVDEGRNVTIDVISNDTDPDGDSLSISSNTQPSSGSVSCNSTSCIYTAPNNLNADIVASFSYTISDGDGGTATATVTVNVNDINHSPSISGSPSNFVNENSYYSFTPTAYDADGDTLTFSVLGKPSWAGFSNSTGRLSGTPNANQSGVYPNIIISVTDGKSPLVPLASFNITVNDVPAPNTPPTISGTPAIEVNENNAYSFTPNAYDADNDTLTFSVSGKPSWAGFTTSTGRLSGTPNSSDVGHYPNIIISVSDGHHNPPTALSSFTIEVKSITLALEIPEELKVTPSLFELTSYTVSWKAVAGATFYELDERQNGGSWAIIPILTGTEIEINNGLTTDWEYQVRACNDSGCSESTTIMIAVQGGDRFQHNDILGSPIVTTDTNGSMIKESTFKPFGQKQE